MQFQAGFNPEVGGAFSADKVSRPVFQRDVILEVGLGVGLVVAMLALGQRTATVPAVSQSPVLIEVDAVPEGRRALVALKRPRTVPTFDVAFKIGQAVRFEIAF